MEFLHDLNKHLRNQRVPRKAAAVFTAATQREVAMIIKCSNGTTISRADSIKDATTKRRFSEIGDNLRLIGIPPNTAKRLLDQIAYELQVSKLTDDNTTDFALEEYQTEAIRTAMVERGVIDEHQFAEGIEAKYGEAA